MASQHDAAGGQSQMRRDDLVNQPSDIHNQGQPNFLQETGTQVMNMAQGAADIGKGAAQGAVSLAKGAALGAANMAQGAADAVKNTLGINNPNSTASTNLPVHTRNNMGASTGHPSDPSTKI